MSPSERYQADLQRADFVEDSAQQLAVRHLQRLYDKLLLPVLPTPRPSFWQQLTRQPAPPVETITGLYFWGGVGRGKTYLMDTFYDCLPFDNKLRVHFHHFMQRVHTELQSLNGQVDPLKVVAANLAKQARIICFDEFFVSDITDAMILGTLFEYLFAEGMILVATSNIPPDELYRNGLQRTRFLPAIALIKQHCSVVNVDSGVDYRLRTLQQANLYHWPLSAEATAALAEYFASLSLGDARWEQEIHVNHRPLMTIAEGAGVLYIDYEELCCTPRSQLDYIELARRYHTIIVANVRAMGPETSDAARRFIALVDEFYERRVKLIFSAAVPMKDLYHSGLLEFEFQRCLSRLIEMQSHEYLAREHLP
ncbi:cell division protein ZapE [Oceanisphaera profunda]|uniref:Cell division protein ZapE n=1 Tax=Oceanisphaera profunda TaxID=1416627 RepID=A0A1Y0D8Y0_9GAMM|nr:cell division protein ZapE [Oceanisphaera profunda]ART84008.1 cell division protein ZapE [Oceanisphaera profunda]